MSNFRPEKLHVDLRLDINNHPTPLPRCYTLTHSDRTGDLFLTIDNQFNCGWYTKLMRDEVLGEWQNNNELYMHIYVHVRSGLVLSPAKWRYGIFKQHLSMTLEAICYWDKNLSELHQQVPILVHFHAKQKNLNNVESWGFISNYLPHKL